MKGTEKSEPNAMVQHHSAGWTSYEHAIAREQFYEYGVCFTDELGRPIDDPEGVRCLAEAEGLVKAA